MNATNPLALLSIVIPARNEEGCIESTVDALCAVLDREAIPYEIIVVDDGSADGTAVCLRRMKARYPFFRAVRNDGANGFGRAIQIGLDAFRGDAVVIYMADASDSPEDVVSYWEQLNRGVDCVFGSRFMKGSQVVDYPVIKLFLNRLANRFIRFVFRIPLNDTTNAFKAYRRNAIEGCRPILSPHFNITVELPLKSIVRGYSWSVIPVCWRNRRSGVSKLRIKEMGSRYFFIVMYIWLEKTFSRGDYHKTAKEIEPGAKHPPYSDV